MRVSFDIAISVREERKVALGEVEKKKIESVVQKVFEGVVIQGRTSKCS